MCIKKSFRPFLKNFTFFLHGIVENGFSATMDIAMALCAHGEPHNMRLKFAICQICQISNAYCAAPRGRTTPWQFPEYLKCPSLRYCEERNLNFSKITKMGFSLSGAGSCSISERQIIIRAITLPFRNDDSLFWSGKSTFSLLTWRLSDPMEKVAHRTGQFFGFRNFKKSQHLSERHTETCFGSVVSYKT